MVDFVATGGYALQGLRALRQNPPGQGRPLPHQPSAHRPAIPPQCRHHRRRADDQGAAGALAHMRRARRGNRRRGHAGAPSRAAAAMLGELEEYFIEGLTPGDTFVFSGEVLRFEALVEDEAYVSRAPCGRPRKSRPMRAASFRSPPIWRRGCATLISQPPRLARAAGAGARMARIQQWRSRVPMPGELLVETFPRADKNYLVCYPFEGRLAHQTLGMLLTRGSSARGCVRWASSPTNMRSRCGALAIRPWAIRSWRTLARAAVRRGHAGRRPRSLARRIRR